MSEKDTKDRVEDLTTINFSITKCPLKIFKRFSQFCKQETNDNYAFGLKMLLDALDTNVKEVVMWEQITALRDDFEKHKAEDQPVERKKPKTMGSG